MEENKEVIKLLGYAYRYLGYRARTKKEMEDFFKKKSEKFPISPKAVEQTLQYLEEEGYINDQEFIEAYISSRNNLKPKSSYALTIELMRKGIDRNLVETYFEIHPANEGSLARKALQRKWSMLQKLPPDARDRKAINFLRSRGFEYDLIKRTIEELEFEE